MSLFECLFVGSKLWDNLTDFNVNGMKKMATDFFSAKALYVDATKSKILEEQKDFRGLEIRNLAR